MNYKNLPYYKEVLRGMAWLDEHRDGWLDRANLDTLDVVNPSTDVIGQTGEVDPALGINPFFGFDAHSDNCEDEDYSRLTETWRQMIELRRRLPEIPEGAVFVGEGELPEEYQRATPTEQGYFIESIGSWRYTGRGYSGDSKESFYCSRPDSRLVTEWLFENQPLPEKENVMDKEWTIYENGDISFKGTLLKKQEVKDVRLAVDNLLEHEEQFIGSRVRLNIGADTLIHVGCTNFTMQEFEDFCEEYDREEWKEEQAFRCGQRFVYGNAEYMLIFPTNRTAVLANTKTGTRWVDAVPIGDRSEVKLSEVAPGREDQFTPIEE